MGQRDGDGRAAGEVPRAGHDVERGESAGAGAIETSVVDVNGVEDANVWLNRCAAVCAPAAADVVMGVDEAGHDEFAGSVDALGVCRDLCAAVGRDRDDFAALHDENAVGDGVADDGDDLSAQDVAPGRV